MIDTDKYEGHTPGPWEVRTHYDTTCVCYSKDDDSECSFVKIHEEHENEEDAQLIADAPLLLAEVKRLQKEVRKQSNIVGMINDLVYDGGSHNLTWDEFNEILGGDEE